MSESPIYSSAIHAVCRAVKNVVETCAGHGGVPEDGYLQPA